MKKCRNCNEDKSLSGFSLASGNRDGRNNTCKPCVVIRNTLYWQTPAGRISYIYNGQKRSSKERGHPAPTYTQKELTEWALANGLVQLVHTWASAGHSKNLVPSIDR